jgi:hypothetical protein
MIQRKQGYEDLSKWKSAGFSKALVLNIANLHFIGKYPWQ